MKIYLDTQTTDFVYERAIPIYKTSVLITDLDYVESNSIVTVIGCDTCNAGSGYIRIYENKSWNKIGEVLGRQPRL